MVGGDCRLLFFSACFFFSRSRFNLEALEGLVFFRGLGLSRASFMSPKKRLVTSSLFLCWLLDTSLCKISSFLLVRRDFNFFLSLSFPSSEIAAEGSIIK